MPGARGPRATQHEGDCLCSGTNVAHADGRWRQLPKGASLRRFLAARATLPQRERAKGDGVCTVNKLDQPGNLSFRYHREPVITFDSVLGFKANIKIEKSADTLARLAIDLDRGDLARLIGAGTVLSD